MTLTRSAVLVLSFASMLSAIVPASAEEGMWMPQQIPALAGRLEALGFDGDPAIFGDLAGHPMGAVVSLGGCSASFVSPEGLIVTNHHCVTGALQYNATPEVNLLEEGFVGRTRAEEKWNGPGSRVYVTTRVLEVTDDLARRLSTEMADRRRYEVVETWSKERTAACEKDGSRCRIAPFFGGLRWFEIKQLEIQDVRLVYAPPRGIGEFGGEADNWRWPRHVGDFAFLRAYVGPDGKSAPHAAKNVPYRPKRWLEVSAKGAGPGDVVFVAGYPGRTQRHPAADEIVEAAEWRLPRSVRRAEEQIAILSALAKTSPEVEIKLETRLQGLNNGLTRNRGILDGLLQGGVLEKRTGLERDLETWIAASEGRLREFGDVLPAMRALEAEDRATRERDAVFGELTGGSGTLLGAADTIVQMAVNRGKPDDRREPAYQERNWSRIREALDRMQRNLDPTVDRAVLRYQLLEASRLAAGERIGALDGAIGLSAGAVEGESATKIDAFLDRLYAGTKLFDKSHRLSLLDRPLEEIRKAGDPILDFAIALVPFGDDLRETGKRRQGGRYRLLPRYMKARLDKEGGLVAPDANSTLRVTYGRVTGVEPRDGLVYKPQTTLAGIVAKHQDEGEFRAPARLLEAIRARQGGKPTPFVDPALGDVPVNFLSTVDTTGGNSGSPTLDAKGRLCGLLFDGVYDTVASDILYDPVKTRAIHVDSRYLLWVLTEVDGATRILEELRGPAPDGGPEGSR